MLILTPRTRAADYGLSTPVVSYHHLASFALITDFLPNTAVQAVTVCDRSVRNVYLFSCWGLCYSCLPLVYIVLFKLYLEKDRYNVYEDDGSVMIRVLASRPAPKNTIVTIQLSDDSAISECPMSSALFV